MASLDAVGTTDRLQVTILRALVDEDVPPTSAELVERFVRGGPHPAASSIRELRLAIRQLVVHDLVAWRDGRLHATRSAQRAARLPF